MKTSLASIIAFFLIQVTMAQSRQIETAVTYLRFTPDARGNGIGTIGAASTPDDFSSYWNPAKYAFSEKKFGAAISNTPFYWLLIQDEDPWDFSFGFKAFNLFFKLKDKMAISTSMRYYSIGEVTFTDEFGSELGIYDTYDFCNDISFSYKISQSFSLGISGRLIYSNLTQGQFVQGAETTAGISIAMDLAGYFQKPISLGSKEGSLAFGLNISNIGSKISYSQTAVGEEFIPTNFGAGVGFTTKFNSANSLTILADINKLLVPTPPIYLRDTTLPGNPPVYDDQGNPVIDKGMDPNVSAIRGMFQSWYDAPNGFKEEMQEWSVGIGVEYWLFDKFSARAGLYYENETKGTRRYFTTGLGIRFGYFGYDIGLLIPFEESNSNTFNLRSSLMIDIGSRNK
jgi:hypothetical protein